MNVVEWNGQRFYAIEVDGTLTIPPGATPIVAEATASDTVSDADAH